MIVEIIHNGKVYKTTPHQKGNLINKLNAADRMTVFADKKEWVMMDEYVSCRHTIEVICKHGVSRIGTATQLQSHTHFGCEECDKKMFPHYRKRSV